MHEQPAMVRVAPGARENGTCKDFSYSYREPSLVPHAEKAKVCLVRSTEGIRQISSVTSEEGVPTALAKLGPVGRSDKEGPTV